MNQDDFQKPVESIAAQWKKPRVLISPTRAAYFGPGLNLRPHKNAAATVAIGLERAFALKLFDQKNTPERSRTIALIPPGTMHHLKAFGAMAFVYLDALSDDFENVSCARIELDCLHSRQQFLKMLSFASSSQNPAIALEMICKALGIPRRPAKQKRLIETIREIDRRPQAFHTIASAAQLAGLSVSRLQHVFRKEVGMPFRRYRLWRRMIVVARTLNTGGTLTEAALEAGFSSSSHFSATFRNMFGMKPTDLIATGACFEIAS